MVHQIKLVWYNRQVLVGADSVKHEQEMFHRIFKLSWYFYAKNFYMLRIYAKK